MIIRYMLRMTVVYSIFDVYDQIGAGMQILGVRYDDPEGKVCFNSGRT